METVMTPSSVPSVARPVSERLARRASRHIKERIIEAILFASAAISVFVTLGIVYVLLKEFFIFFSQVSIVDFLTDTQWTPLFDDAHFGIIVLLSGTAVSLSLIHI